MLQAMVGGVSEADVALADASDAVIIAFNVVPDERARSLAEELGVQVRRYEIIYQVTDDLRKALEGMLAPERREAELGRAVVQRTFSISRLGMIAGCRVIGGIIARNARLRLIRDSVVMGDYAIDSLKREKDDAREVRDRLQRHQGGRHSRVLQDRGSCPHPLVSTRRLLKAAEAVREVVSMAILTEVRDPRVKDVTVTGVEMAPDMRSATVHVSVMGSPASEQLALRGLANAAGFLQSRIADRIETRYTPRLRFELDAGVKHSIEIARMLGEVLPAAAEALPAAPSDSDKPHDTPQDDA